MLTINIDSIKIGVMEYANIDASIDKIEDGKPSIVYCTLQYFLHRIFRKINV